MERTPISQPTLTLSSAGALRIDNMERMANQLNDIEISPTNYMASFLKQRGWTLPERTIVIPNVVGDADRHEQALAGPKKVELL